MSSRSSRAAAAVLAAFAILAGIGWCADSSDTDLDSAGSSPVSLPGSDQFSTAIDAPPADVQPDPGAEGAPVPAPVDPPAVEAPVGDPLIPAAREALPRLEVKGRAPKTGYERDLFGQAWSDDVSVEFGRNGCDTRNDILRRDLQEITVRPGTRDCVIQTGVLYGPFTGERIDFVRGQGTSDAVQIDHVVALSDAWQKGAQGLSPEQRRDFANDPLNLLAVAGWANQQKSDGDAATWLPPRREFRCSYVSRQILVKERYGLWVTSAERDAMERELSSC